MRKIKSKLSLCLALLLVVSCVAGSLAYFSDRVTAQAQVSTMDDAISITPEEDPTIDPDDPDKDPSDPDDPYVDPTPDIPDDDLANWWAYLNSIAINNFNPGDKMSLGYKLVNDGKLDVKIRETFVITSSEEMTFNSNGMGEQFALCTGTAAFQYGGVEASTFTGMTFTKLSDTQYKVTIDGSELAQGASASKAYFLVFAPTADNDFQGATCEINYLVEAMQADGDWATVVTSSLVMNGHSVEAVPAA